MRYLITGATGFVGGHVAEACRKRGWPVSALVRPTSDCADLEKWGVTLYRAGLGAAPGDAQIIRQAVLDTDIVVHCAARLGDWGPVDDYRKVNVEGLRLLLDACKDQPLHKFIHISTLGVYAARHHYGTDETAALPARHRDGYSQSKMEAEKLALSYCHEYGLPVVILRPGFVYGPRDKIVFPRIVENLKAGKVRYPGGGNGALNTIFISNLVDAIFLAVDRENAVGQVYNLTDGEFVSKKQFIEKIANALDLPHPRRRPPYWFAWLVTWCCEAIARMRGAKEAPLFCFPRLKFMGTNLDFSVEKARRQLGYNPKATFEDGMCQTIAWYKEAFPT